MKLEFDLERTRVRVDGQWIQGTKRWEACTVQTLVEAARSGRNDLTRDELASCLQRRGQVAPLDRTGLRRLWSAVAAMFERAGKSPEFSARFECGPRALTVGPWRWRHDRDAPFAAGDRAGQGDTRQRSREGEPMHAVARGHSLENTFALARKIGLAQSARVKLVVASFFQPITV